jgi:glycosyltransferase involved in cell wall biosynthesis
MTTYDEADRIRVLRIIARMNVGGPAWQTSVLTRGLGDHGFETRLLSGHLDDGEADFVTLRDPDLEVVPIAGLGRSIRLGGDLRAFWYIYREIRRFNPMIVHTHTAKAGVIGRMAAVAARVPIRVHTFHGHVLHGYFSPLTTRFVRLLERVLARHTTALVSVGHRVGEELVAAGIGTAEKFTAIAPGVGSAENVPDRAAARALHDLPATGPVVLFVGRLTGVKRLDRLLDAFRQVLTKVPDATLVVAGQGDLIEEVRSDAQSLRGSVRFLGWQPDVATLYAASDVVVISSDNEGMPVTLIEAAMAGVPGVTTDVGSASEVVEDQATGLVVSTDAEAIAEALIELLSDPGRRLDMGSAAGIRARQCFSSERLVADHAALYRRLTDSWLA